MVPKHKIWTLLIPKVGSADVSYGYPEDLSL